MHYSKYDVSVSMAYDYFEFISVGSKGEILKAILFHQTEANPSFYNCILGDVKEDGRIDAWVITNNGDMEKVLATVVAAAFVFSFQYPDCHIVLKGSNKIRTRLYRMAINVNYDTLIEDFDISGMFEADEIIEHFEKGTVKDYDAFLVKRK